MKKYRLSYSDASLELVQNILGKLVLDMSLFNNVTGSPSKLDCYKALRSHDEMDHRDDLVSDWFRSIKGKNVELKTLLPGIITNIICDKLGVRLENHGLEKYQPAFGVVYGVIFLKILTPHDGFFVFTVPAFSSLLVECCEETQHDTRRRATT
jgi:hypothetical protein